MLPTGATIEAAPKTSIVSSKDLAGIFGVDPDIVEIAVAVIGDRAEALASVDTQQQRPIDLENFIFIFRVDY